MRFLWSGGKTGFCTVRLSGVPLGVMDLCIANVLGGQNYVVVWQHMMIIVVLVDSSGFVQPSVPCGGRLAVRS